MSHGLRFTVLITYRKRTVSSQSEELAAIEARLRATEERLARVARSQQSSRATSQARNLPTTTATTSAGTSVTGQENNTQAYGGAETAPRTDSVAYQQPAKSQSGQDIAQAQQPRGAVRPPNPPRGDSLGLPPIPGAMPITPQAAEPSDDYISANSRQ